MFLITNSRFLTMMYWDTPEDGDLTPKHVGVWMLMDILWFYSIYVYVLVYMNYYTVYNTTEGLNIYTVKNNTLYNISVSFKSFRNTVSQNDSVKKLKHFLTQLFPTSKSLYLHAHAGNINWLSWCANFKRLKITIYITCNRIFHSVTFKLSFCKGQTR